ncbi:helix-turn-helix domain-containing protein [Microlunatus sp. Gsoil 973]|jgi:transcriptional regulator with XRE-family HTH domain|uniref:helix-turn-helix domain-containing protein n=1 Tax=Microlunatus sp. Gsoil 973 TaxID=2672569 RepID=UPI0012B45F95|nr:helix-turn-helix transcriptional regulator [Microlunatus sp. Gsoil 973]QGN34843.1 helix-turn-helix domain-containing protein [Microlunatus sp. Gsoil 973]
MTEAAQRTDQEQPDGRSRPDGTVVPLNRRPDRRDPLLRTLLGGVLRQARHDQQRTLSDVADRAGISVPYLSEIERGRKEPSSEMLAAVCGALELDLVDLVSRTYIDLIARRAQAAEADRPRTVAARRITGRVGRAGDVLALAA